ncbi:hypothetical protein CVT26_006495 [Gymnopilus dilepis]|uniref:Terpene synthase n=1 Tax=Gymnopilus dilepis TaxID=231916 RepID=A0A409W175_9AGAR|nr:hypothetical protein CVT26_006495 [Gymnopilus dilepis]
MVGQAQPVLRYTLPDLLAEFPWPRHLSEHYEECKAESTAWTESYRAFDKVSLKTVDLGDFNLLACLTYGPRDKELIRLGCDLMNLFYVFDEYTDVLDGSGAEKLREIMMDAFKNPEKERPADELPVGAMARDFWIRASRYVSADANCVQHFFQYLDAYSKGVVNEAEDRADRKRPTFEEFLPLRRNWSGCMPCFSLCEFGLDVPEEAYQHPRMVALREATTDIVAITNDIYSYAREKERGLESQNPIELLMAEKNLSVQGAIDYLAQYIAQVQAAFLDNVANMPSWGEDADRKVKMYIDGLAQWIRGNDDWSFEGGRYFGKRGAEIQKSRVVTLQLRHSNKRLLK